MVGGALFLYKHFTESVAFVLSCISLLNSFKMVGKRGFEVLQISPYPPSKINVATRHFGCKYNAKNG